MQNINPYNKIAITKDDLLKTVYFTYLKFNIDPLHMQGTSSKSDFLGGFIERWFNISAQTIVLNKMLENKNYQVISDYFFYTNKTQKNAPDVLGLQFDDNRIVPFTKFNDTSWQMYSNMPKIEIKVFRKNQYLLAVRESQLDSDYYIFVESDLREDYLANIFEDSFFDDHYFNMMKMDDIFIERDTDDNIVKPTKIAKPSIIGTFKLIGCYTKKELENYFTLCKRGVSPYYCVGAKNVSDARNVTKHISLKEKSKYDYDNEIDDSIYLPFSIISESNFKMGVIKKYKSTFYVDVKKPIAIEHNNIQKGQVKVTFKHFLRSSRWDEFLCTKSLITAQGKDSILDLINFFDSLV